MKKKSVITTLMESLFLPEAHMIKSKENLEKNWWPRAKKMGFQWIIENRALLSRWLKTNTMKILCACSVSPEKKSSTKVKNQRLFTSKMWHLVSYTNKSKLKNLSKRSSMSQFRMRCATPWTRSSRTAISLSKTILCQW